MHDANIQRYEDAFAAQYGVPHVIAVNSGSAALLAALLALRIPRDRAVLVPAYAWPQLAGVPEALGYPVDFVDVDGNGLLDVGDLERRLTATTGAVVVCHLFGNPSPAAAAVALADRWRVPVIEDCSQALFATDQGRLAGTWGAFGFCSTGALKPLSTDEGGLLWTGRPGLFAEAFALTQHNRRAPYDWLREDTLRRSLSLRLHPAAARRGWRQLIGLRERVAGRSARIELIRAILHAAGVETPETPPGSKASWQHCPVLPDAGTRPALSPYLTNYWPAQLLCLHDERPGAGRYAAAVEFINEDRIDAQLFRAALQPP